jgi:hypothetical protein
LTICRSIAKEGFNWFEGINRNAVTVTGGCSKDGISEVQADKSSVSAKAVSFITGECNKVDINIILRGKFSYYYPIGRPVQ